MRRRYLSAPDDDEAAAEIMRMKREVTAVLLIQQAARYWAECRRDAAVRDAAVTYLQAVVRGKATRGWPSRISAPSSEPDGHTGDEDCESAFTIRNLDTGEATTVVVDTRDIREGGNLASLNFGSLQRGTSAWEATRLECRGLLEKLASHSTVSFRSYQLCVWQERYVFAEDDAICYQQVRAGSIRCERWPSSSPLPPCPRCAHAVPAPCYRLSSAHGMRYAAVS